MGIKHPLIAGFLLSATSLNAHALTTAYTGAGGAGLVYSRAVGWVEQRETQRML